MKQQITFTSATLPPQLLPAMLNSRKVKQMYSDVVFGSPSANCNGLGVCKITTIGQAAKQYGSCQSVGGLFSKDQQGDLQVLIPKSKVCVMLFRKYFMKGKIELKKPCPIPQYLQQYLGYAKPALTPGCYPIFSEGQYFLIVFRQST